MDIKESVQAQLDKTGISKPLAIPPIQTMLKDMAVLKSEKKESSPPAGLPVAESAIPKPAIPKPIPSLPSRLDQLKEKKPKPSLADQKELKTESEVEKNYLKFALIGLVAILIIGGIGGFFYWWNYIRIVVPPIVYHYKCQDQQCVSVEGEGENQCQVNEDCQLAEPAEPVIPDPLISINKTSVIELSVGQENLLFDELKTFMAKEQASSTFSRILVKTISPTQKKYMDLATLIPVLKANFPISVVQAIADSENVAGNYTLFSYSQAKGNRLGIIISLTESADLVQELKNWETSIVSDLEPFFMDLAKQPATADGFQDNVYKETNIRYLNFNDPNLSIDYAVKDDKLIITTSRNSMFAVIDALID